MKQRTYRPHSSKLPERMQELADSLLAPLLRRFLLAELFWEESRRSIVDFDANGSSYFTQKWLRGVQLRAIDESSAATSWTTDLSAGGLARSFRKLEVGLSPPRLFSWPEEKPLRLISSTELLSWREAAAELVARARGLLQSAQLNAQFLLEEYARGSAAGTGTGRQRRGRRILMKINAVRNDGTLLRRARFFEGKVTPEVLIDSGLVQDIRMAWDDDPRKVGGLAGFMPVVVASGQGSGLFHEMVGHSLEADYVLTGASPFSECKYGDEVTHSELTITDSPDPTFGCGGISLDDEGQIPKPITLVDSGMLAGMLHDRVTATMAGTSPTGNGRREDFRMEPAPRMRNIVVSPGPHSHDALLSGIRRGLYAERLAGGRADLAPGHFTLVVESGRRIEQGRLREPLRNVLIRGDVLQTLSDIEGVGNDWHVSPEPMFCGKRGVVITGIAGPSVRLGHVEVFS